MQNALAIAVCRHSGEHSQFVMSFSNATSYDELVIEFQNKMTDRWTYKLRQIASMLPDEAGVSELNRLLGRIEGSTKEQANAFRELVQNLWVEHKQQLTQRNWSTKEILSNFITLCQSAAFMARGKE